MDETFHLAELADQILETARSSSAGRTARNLWGGPDTTMTQTVIAVAQGRELDEHLNPGEATVHVLQGQVELRARSTTLEGRSGDLLIVPEERHSLYAVSDAVLLLTAAKVRT